MQSASALPRKRKMPWSTMLGREELWGFILVAPWLLGYLLFQAGPIIASLFLSFTEYTILNPPKWIGMDNFVRLFRSDPLFWKTLRITTVYTVFAVPITVAVGYLMALMLNQKVKALSVFRTVYYLPAVVPGVSMAYLALGVFAPQDGLLNAALKMIGVKEPPTWYASPEWVLPTFVLLSLWTVGGGMVLYLASLQGVPTELYDAASVDGATAWSRFRHITLPMTSPIIFFNLLTGMIGALQTFSGPYIVTNGGPNNASLFYSLYLYRNAFQYLKMGYASAMAWILFIIILILTFISLYLSDRWVYYGSEAQNG